jgi:hypothetical protein
VAADAQQALTLARARLRLAEADAGLADAEAKAASAPEHAAERAYLDVEYWQRERAQVAE